MTCNLRGGVAALALLALVLVAAPAQAALYNLQFQPNGPDIYLKGLKVTYDAATDALSITGNGLSVDKLKYNGVSTPVSNDGFSLTATIDAAGDLLGGAMTISGTAASLGFNSGTLLTGSLSNVGFPESGGSKRLQFFFHVTGGDAASLYGGVGALGAMEVSSTGFSTATQWTSNFTNVSLGIGMGTADVGTPVPEPASLAIWGVLLGLGGAPALKRRLRKARCG